MHDRHFVIPVSLAGSVSDAVDFVSRGTSDDRASVSAQSMDQAQSEDHGPEPMRALSALREILEYRK